MGYVYLMVGILCLCSLGLVGLFHSLQHGHWLDRKLQSRKDHRRQQRLSHTQKEYQRIIRK